MSTQQPDSNSDLPQAIESNDNSLVLATVPEFCRKYRISTSTFYRNVNNMPKAVFIGKHPMILFQDEQEWLVNLPKLVPYKSS